MSEVQSCKASDIPHNAEERPTYVAGFQRLNSCNRTAALSGDLPTSTYNGIDANLYCICDGLPVFHCTRSAEFL